MPTLVAHRVAPTNACAYPAARQQPRGDCPAEREWRDDAERRDQDGRKADLQHLRHGGLDADLEQQEQHADASEHVNHRIGLDRREPCEADVAEDNAGHELAEHRGLAQPNRKLAGQLPRNEEDRQHDDHVRDGVGMRGVGRGGERERECRQVHYRTGKVNRTVVP